MSVFHKASRPCALAAAVAAVVSSLVAGPVVADDEVRLTHKQLTRNTSSLDASVSTDKAQFESTAIASLRTKDSSLTRLDTAVTLAPEDAVHRLKLGDSTSNPGSWGSAVRFAGLQWGTPFEMRQDVLNAPRLALAGVAVMPTTADALLGAVNAPGAAFSARGLSTGKVTPGMGGMAFTARDAAGRSTSLNRSLLAGPRTGDSVGCNNYSLSVGRVRENFGLDENRYGPVFANTTLACGLGGGRLLEAHGEYLAGQATLAGLSLAQPLPMLGTASLAAATSDNTQGSGYALQMGLHRDISRIAVGVQARVQTPEYRELGTATVQDGIAQRVLASVATSFSSTNTLALAYAMQRTFGLERTDVVGLTQTLKFSRGGQFSFGANHSVNDQKYSSVNLSFARALSY